MKMSCKCNMLVANVLIYPYEEGISLVADPFIRTARLKYYPYLCYRNIKT